MTEYFHWDSREPVENPADYNYITTDKCDGCGEEKRGIMMHSAGATGRVCPVLFLCEPCAGEKLEEYLTDNPKES